MKPSLIRACVAAALVIAAGAIFLGTWQHRQRLGTPGVRVVNQTVLGVDDTGPQVGNTNTFVAATNAIYLPENIGDFESTNQPISKVVLDWLPKDTTYGQRLYKSKDGFSIQANAVLMGNDRTSIHQPEYCLPMQGWGTVSRQPAHIPISRPRPYELPVMRINSRQTYKDANGKEQTVSSVFVYWFVAENQLTANHRQRMWWMARDLLRTGVLQRWAYITCFAICPTGQEEAAYTRIKQFITEAVPHIQVTPTPDAPVELAAQTP